MDVKNYWVKDMSKGTDEKGFRVEVFNNANGLSQKLRYSVISESFNHLEGKRFSLPKYLQKAILERAKAFGWSTTYEEYCNED